MKQPWRTSPEPEKIGPRASYNWQKISLQEAARKEKVASDRQAFSGELSLCAHLYTGLRDLGRLLR